MRRRDFLALGAAGAAALARAPEAWARSPRQGGALKHIGLDPASFDIQGSVAPETQLISSFVRRTLFKLSPGRAPGELALVPDLALRADLSDAGRTCTLVLRRGVRWEQRAPLHGRELTAADVRYTLERALKRSPHAGLLGPLQSVEATDRHTVRAHLAEPFAPFVHNLADPWLAILAPEVEDKHGDFRSSEALIGCGPFVLERYEPGAKALFARNPLYHGGGGHGGGWGGRGRQGGRRGGQGSSPEGGRPYLDRVEWIFLRDRATQISLFRAGQVDIPSHDGRISRAEAASLRLSSPDYSMVAWDPLGTRSLALRLDRPPLGDARVRRALSLAIDRKSWVAQRFDGQGSEGQGPVPAAMREWALPLRDLGEGARYLVHDPAQARRLLAEAGFAAGLRIKCAPAAALGPEQAEELDFLAASLRHVGVELQLGSAGKLEEASWGPSPLHTELDGHLQGALRTGHADNRSRVADSKLDAMLDAQRRTISRPARRQVVAEIQRHVAERVYYVYTPVPRSFGACAPRVKGYVPGDSLDRGAQLEGVWLEEA